MRLSIINFAGIARTLVAVGRVSESSMLLTTREATPRRTSTRAALGVIKTGAGRTTGSAGVGVVLDCEERTTCWGAVAAGGAACAGAGVTGAGAAEAIGVAAEATGATGATGAGAVVTGATGAGAATTGAAETSLARTCVGVGTLGALVADLGIGGTPPRGAVGIAP